MEFHVIIPARYHSSRFPGKVLADLNGKPMIEHVYERALASKAESVVIATDSEQIQSVAEKFGAQVCMTSEDHQSGTERISEAVNALEYEDDAIIVGLQADEPLISPSVIQEVAEDLNNYDNVKVATLCTRATSLSEIKDPNTVKVVLNRRNYAMYFSRLPIPWFSDLSQDDLDLNRIQQHWIHVGLYAYRSKFLQQYIDWMPCSLEKNESLEQLRILWNGGRIHVRIHEGEIPLGVDSPVDLERARLYLQTKI